ncbi:hypothetical protein V8E36_003161 [Tilletia maclaganii]
MSSSLVALALSAQTKLLALCPTSEKLLTSFAAGTTASPPQADEAAQSGDYMATTSTSKTSVEPAAGFKRLDSSRLGS